MLTYCIDDIKVDNMSQFSAKMMQQLKKFLKYYSFEKMRAVTTWRGKKRSYDDVIKDFSNSVVHLIKSICI